MTALASSLSPYRQAMSGGGSALRRRPVSPVAFRRAPAGRRVPASPRRDARLDDTPEPANDTGPVGPLHPPAANDNDLVVDAP